jgi:hypothetical protein
MNQSISPQQIDKSYKGIVMISYFKEQGPLAVTIQ